MKKLCVFAVLVAGVPMLAAQSKPGNSTSAATAAPVVNAVSHTTKAMHYRPGANTKLPFQATELMAGASGEAKIEAKKTTIAIDAKIQGVEEATKFGLEYLTYVLWAVSPEGRADNLGELVVKKGTAELKSSTDMQTFGLIVTAEPYFAVTQPGNMVVMEGSVPQGEEIGAKFELVGKGTYSSTNERIQNAIFGIDRSTPMELFEARNAVRIAHIAAGDKYATSILAKADQQLAQAEQTYRGKQGKTAIDSAARETAQTAEAEQAQRDAEAATAEAQRMKAEAQAAAQEAARQKAEAEQAKAEALAQQQALAEQAASAQKAAAESEQMRQEADQLRQQAEAQRQQAEKEKQELRARLLQQLNSILSTRDSARGLIANMSDVLFKSGSFELLPGARERLAKVSGIVLAYPTLHLQVEGHTDSVGTDEYNQNLSEHRAQAVRDYLVQQGISANTIGSRGLGKTQPIATNDTPEGRQQNRRVELVLSGDAIGNNASASAAGVQQ